MPIREQAPRSSSKRKRSRSRSRSLSHSSQSSVDETEAQSLSPSFSPWSTEPRASTDTTSARKTPRKPAQRRQRVRRVQRPVRPDVEVISISDSSSSASDSEEKAVDVVEATATAIATATTATATAAAAAAAVAAAVMERLESDDYFEVLGLTRQATAAEVKKAYRRLAVQWHPDKNREHPQAEAYFKRIAEAYAVLSDPQQRMQYERFGKPGLGQESGASTDEYGPRGQQRPFRASSFSARHAQDIFEAFFGGANPFDAMFGGGGMAQVHGHHMRGGFAHGFDDEPDENGAEWDDMAHDFGMPLGGLGFGMGMGMNMGMGAGMSHARASGGGGAMSHAMGLHGMMHSMMQESMMGGGMGMSMMSGGGGGSVSQSVSSSSFTDRNGHTITKRTTTTVHADGRQERVTEEFRNGALLHSHSNAGSSSRLTGAARMQLGSRGSSGREI